MAHAPFSIGKALQEFTEQDTTAASLRMWHPTFKGEIRATRRAGGRIVNMSMRGLTMGNGLQIAVLGSVAFLCPSLAAKGPRAATSPAAVVRQYCQLDMNGTRLSSQNPYVDRISALGTWPIEPGWDSAIVVKDFVIVRAHTGQRISSVVVRYTLLGQMTGSRVTPASQRVQVVKFFLERSGNAWKIKRPLIPPHVSVQAAVAALCDLLSGEKDPQRRKRLEQGLAVLRRWQHASKAGPTK